MRKIINLNEYVYVKLDQKGKEIYKKYYDNKIVITDNQGYTKFHLWEFMGIFGNNIELGVVPPFDMNILIDEESLK